MRNVKPNWEIQFNSCGLLGKTDLLTLKRLDIVCKTFLLNNYGSQIYLKKSQIFSLLPPFGPGKKSCLQNQHRLVALYQYLSDHFLLQNVSNCFYELIQFNNRPTVRIDATSAGNKQPVMNFSTISLHCRQSPHESQKM